MESVNEPVFRRGPGRQNMSKYIKKDPSSG